MGHHERQLKNSKHSSDKKKNRSSNEKHARAEICGPIVPRDDAKISGELKSRLDSLAKAILHGNLTTVPYDDVIEVCLRGRELFLSEHVLLRLEPPLYVFGDIHGQLDDLVHMLNTIGVPPRNRLLFLGDYVDRGPHGLTIVVLLTALKLRYPDQVYLLRGNHETRLVNRRYGFFDECLDKYGVDQGLQVYTEAQHVFNCLPLAALVGKRIFCVHGGISDSLVAFQQFDRIVRPCDVGDVGLSTDLIWSDPTDRTEGYAPSHRGASSIFGSRAISTFCQSLGVDLIVRAHQLPNDDGYEHFGAHVITLFSAPGYHPDSAAAMLRIDPDLTCQVITWRKPSATAKEQPRPVKMPAPSTASPTSK